MSTPADQITAGLKARRIRPTPTKPASGVRFGPAPSIEDLPGPPRVLIEIADLHRMAGAANSIHSEFTKYVLVANSATAERAKKILDAAARDGISRTVTDTWHQNIVDELRRKDAGDTQDARLDTYKKLRGLREKADGTASFYDSPVQIVQRHMLGSEERSRMVAQIASAGPQALSDYAALAMSQGHKGMLMATAILARVDSLEKAARESLRFSRQSLAYATAGEAHARASFAISVVRNRETNVAHLNRLYGQANSSGDYGKIQIQHATMIEKEMAILRAVGITID